METHAANSLNNHKPDQCMNKAQQCGFLTEDQTVHTPGNHEGIQGLIYSNKTLQNVIMGCKNSHWQICPIGFSNQERESTTS